MIFDKILKGRRGRPPGAQMIWHVANEFKTSLRFAATRLRETFGARFGAGLANLVGQYWEWQFAIGAPASRMSVLSAAITDPRQMKDGRYFDDARRRPRSFDALKIGPDRVLVVVGP